MQLIVMLIQAKVETNQL